MAAIVYRWARVVLQNSTNELLTIEGTEVLTGVWTRGCEAHNGEVIDRQSARAFGTESTELQRGISAYVRLGSVSGYAHLRWVLPWVGDFRCEVETTDGLRTASVLVNDEDPAAIAALVTIAPRASKR